MEPSKQLSEFTPEQVNRLLHATLDELELTGYSDSFKSGLLSGVEEAQARIAQASKYLPPDPLRVACRAARDLLAGDGSTRGMEATAEAMRKAFWILDDALSTSADLTGND